MAKYVFKGSNPVSIPALGFDLKPGEKFETDEQLNHPDIELIKSDKPKAEASAKEG